MRAYGPRPNPERKSGKNQQPMSALDEILTAVKQGKLDNNRLSADQRDVIQQHWDELTTTVFAIWAPYPRPTQDTVLAWEEEGAARQPAILHAAAGAGCITILCTGMALYKMPPCCTFVTYTNNRNRYCSPRGESKPEPAAREYHERPKAAEKFMAAVKTGLSIRASHISLPLTARTYAYRHPSFTVSFTALTCSGGLEECGRRSICEGWVANGASNYTYRYKLRCHYAFWSRYFSPRL